jgi:hypothetical protein
LTTAQKIHLESGNRANAAAIRLANPTDAAISHLVPSITSIMAAILDASVTGVAWVCSMTTWRINADDAISRLLVEPFIGNALRQGEDASL